MEIRHIRLQNFKRFSEVEFTFSPGLNVIKGPNEAGKSTLHEAIVVSLLNRPTGKQSEGKYLSWGKDQLYEVDLSCQLPSGERFRIYKDFEARTHEVHGPNGVDRSRSGLNAALLEALGTTSEKLFSSTASIRQDAMMDLDKGGKEISTQLQEIAMGGVSGVNDAIDQLEDRILEFERGWKTNAPRNPGPIGQLKKQIADLDEHIQSIAPEVSMRDEAKEELFQQRDQIAAIESDLEPLHALRTSYAVRQELKRDLGKYGQMEQELEEKIDQIQAAERRKEQVQKRLDNLKHFISLNGQMEKELGAAREEWKARLAETRDRERRIIELEKRQKEGKKERKFKHLNWIVGIILFGITLVIFSALSDRFLESVFRTSLLLAGGTLTFAGGIWFLMALVRQIRSSRSLEYLLSESRARYESGLIELTSAKDKLKVLLRPFECVSWDEFENGLGKFRKLHSDLEMVEATLSVLLGKGGSRSALEDQRRKISRARRDVQEQLTEFEEIPELSAVDYQNISSEIELLEKERQNRQKQIIRLETLTEKGGSTLEDLHRNMERRAAFQHRLDLAHERHQVLQVTLEGLREVRDLILENAQRELEPRLGVYLEQITRGRYSKAHVDEKLQVQIQHELKDNGFISMEDLSNGTRDQVYLATRLAICDMIFHDARPPLLMDDPFVKFDPDRREAALRLCKEISAERQVILFTCHEGYEAYADQVIVLE